MATLAVNTLLDNTVENDEYFKAFLSLPSVPGHMDVFVGSPDIAFVSITG